MPIPAVAALFPRLDLVWTHIGPQDFACKVVFHGFLGTGAFTKDCLIKLPIKIANFYCTDAKQFLETD
jgi:hypothetical protein